MDYNGWVTALSELLVIEASNANFLAILPNAADYAELRCYRDLNLLNAGVRDGSGQLASGNRLFNLPTPAGGSWLIVESANVITPAATAPDAGTRVPLLKTTQQFIDLIGNTAAQSGTPAAFAMVTDTQLIVGPVPNGAFHVEIVGTIRPTTMSGANPNTILTINFPDLLLAASMVFMAGYQRDFGQQAADPKLGQSWEEQYKTLLNGSATQEARKKVTTFSGRVVGGQPRAA